MTDKAVDFATQILSDAISEVESTPKKKKKVKTVVVEPEVDVVDKTLMDIAKTIKQRVAMKMLQDLEDKLSSGEQEMSKSEGDDFSPREIFQWMVLMDFLESRRARNQPPQPIVTQPQEPPYWLREQLNTLKKQLEELQKQMQQRKTENPQQQTQLHSQLSQLAARIDMLSTMLSLQQMWQPYPTQQQHPPTHREEDPMEHMFKYLIIMQMVDKMTRKHPEMREVAEAIKEGFSKNFRLLARRVKKLEDTVVDIEESRKKQALLKILKLMAKKIKKLDEAIKEKKPKDIKSTISELLETKKQLDQFAKEFGLEKKSENEMTKAIGVILDKLGVSDLAKKIVELIFATPSSRGRVEPEVPPPPRSETPKTGVSQQKIETPKAEVPPVPETPKEESKTFIKKVLEEVGSHVAEYVTKQISK